MFLLIPHFSTLHMIELNRLKPFSQSTKSGICTRKLIVTFLYHALGK